MTDLGGGGRRPSPDLRVDVGVSLKPTVGRSVRASSSAGGLARAADGRFCSVSKGSDVNMVDDLEAAANLEVSCDGRDYADDELMAGGSPHPAPPGFSNFGGTSFDEVEANSCTANGCEKNVLGNDVCMVNDIPALVGSLPSSSLKFCLGTGKAPDAIPITSKSCSQGVWLNASSQLHEVGVQSKAGFGSGLAWQRPKVIPMAPISALGKFSEDGSTAILDEDEVDATIKKFDTAIVGRLFGRRIPYPQLVNELKHRWGTLGEFKLVTVSGDCFVCFFESAEVRDSVLLGGPWVLFGQVLGIDRWTPQFSPSSSIGFCTPVWIRMPSLPLYCWSSKNIGRIAALVGEPLWLDAATDQLDRGLFARACVRIDLSQPLKAGVWVEGRHGKFFQPLVYEGLSVFCCRCGQVGHKELVCKSISTPAPLHPDSGKAKLIVEHQPEASGGMQPCSGANRLSNSVINDNATPEFPIDVSPPVDESEKHHGVGPWMMVGKKKNRPNKGRSSNYSRPGSNLFNFHENERDNFGIAYRKSPAPMQNFKGPHASPGRASPIKDRASPGPHPSSCWANDSLQMDHLKPANNGKTALGQANGKQPIFSGFLAMPSMVKNRPSKASGKQIFPDYGPVAFGTRKRRKQLDHADGGDGSPSKPL